MVADQTSQGFGALINDKANQVKILVDPTP